MYRRRVLNIIMGKKTATKHTHTHTLDTHYSHPLTLNYWLGNWCRAWKTKRREFPCTRLCKLQNFPLNPLMFYLFVDVVFDNWNPKLVTKRSILVCISQTLSRGSFLTTSNAIWKFNRFKGWTPGCV